MRLDLINEDTVATIGLSLGGASGLIIGLTKGVNLLHIIFGEISFFNWEVLGGFVGAVLGGILGLLIVSLLYPIFRTVAFVFANIIGLAVILLLLFLVSSLRA